MPKTRLEAVDQSAKTREELFVFARNFAAEADRFQAVVDRLPVMEDKVPLVPDMTVWWRSDLGPRKAIARHIATSHIWITCIDDAEQKDAEYDANVDAHELYSTEKGASGK